MFKLVHSNKHGTFSLELNRSVPPVEMTQLVNLASYLIPEEVEEDPQQEIVYGPVQAPSSVWNNQPKFGARPVENIGWGDYKKPERNPVSIKILHLIAREHGLRVIREMRRITGISIMGCKDILFGNFMFPPIELEQAQKLMEIFRSADLHAKIVPIESSTQPSHTEEIVLDSDSATYYND